MPFDSAQPRSLAVGRPKVVLAILLALIVAHGLAVAQQETAAAQPTRFVGTWVGTQAWTIDNPPPGASQEQPVTLTLELVEGKLIGAMTPFLGGEDGATIVDSVIIGEELR